MPLPPLGLVTTTIAVLLAAGAAALAALLALLLAWRRWYRPAGSAPRRLRESQRMLATLMSNLPGMVYRCRNDPDWTMDFVSQGALELTGYPPEDLQESRRLSYAEVIHPDDRDEVWRQVQAAVRERRPFELSYRIVTAEGRTRWVWERGRTVTTADGSFEGLEGFITDVTERSLAAQALRASEENLRITLDSIGDAVIATDAAGRVRRMNPVAEALTGWRTAEAEGRSLPEVFHIASAATRAAVEDPVARVLRERRVVGLANHTILIARDGTERHIADSGAPIQDEAGELVGVVLVFRDVTEELALQEQLRHSQKMRAVGQLAGGIAHDFNNLLTALLGNAQLLESLLPASGEAARCAGEIQRAAQRAGDLTRQLLAFSRRGPVHRTVVDLHGIVEQVIGLLGHSVDRRVTIDRELSAAHQHVDADPSLLEGAVLNLALNACDAMPRGGRLQFLTRDAELDAEAAARLAPDLAPGAYVELKVQDTGCGMDPALRERIFEPFFTTKGEGRGTGLGLASVYGCVESHGGAIRVESAVGRGSSFSLFLPAAAAAAPEPAAVPATLETGTGHVLVVDDEESVRGLAERALGRLGYRVSTCEDGLEAVAFFARHHADVDLVILDLIMPNLGGEDTFHRLREIDPRARVLVASGFSHHRTVDVLLEQGALGFLSKPFRIDTLAHEVAQLLPPAAAREGRPEPDARAGRAT